MRPYAIRRYQMLLESGVWRTPAPPILVLNVPAEFTSGVDAYGSHHILADAARHVLRDQCRPGVEAKRRALVGARNSENTFHADVLGAPCPSASTVSATTACSPLAPSASRPVRTPDTRRSQLAARGFGHPGLRTPAGARRYRIADTQASTRDDLFGGSTRSVAARPLARTLVTQRRRSRFQSESRAAVRITPCDLVGSPRSKSC